METSQGQATIPLTVYDRLFERTTFVTGWVVEGKLDMDMLGHALDRLTDKWRVLAGRIASVKNEKQQISHWVLSVPLGPLPPDYQKYSLTSSISDVPLSNYVSIPLPRVSDSLPHSLFIHPSIPRQYTAWEASNLPLTCWHLTHFNSGSEVDDRPYTCIGFARSHGVFDGIGATLIMQSLVAEMRGEAWKVPQTPSLGVNINPLQVALDDEKAAAAENEETQEVDNSFSVLGAGGTFKLIAWHLRERWWKGAERRIVILPPAVLTFLVNGVRKELGRDNGNEGDVHVSTGDILVGWLIKTIYSTGTPPNTRVHCSNFASFRQYLEHRDPSLLAYPHNAFIPLPYPVMTVKEINSVSLSDFTQRLTHHRASLGMRHILASYQTLQQAGVPLHAESDETFVVSNVSASRILETDWSPLGAKKTVAGYRYQLTPTKTILANAVYISGRLDDGSVVLDATLSTLRQELLTAEVNRMSAFLFI